MRPRSEPVYPVCTFQEADYRFGAGPLRMTIEYVDWSHPVQYDSETWYEIVGVEQTETGREVGRRRALVRARQLPSRPLP